MKIQAQWDVANAVLRGEFTAIPQEILLQPYLKTQENLK